MEGWKQALIFLLVYTAFFYLMGWFLFPLLPDAFPKSLFLSISITSVTSIALVCIFSRITKTSAGELGLSFKGQRRMAASGFCLGTALIGLGSLLLLSFGWLQWTSSPDPAFSVLFTILLLLLSAISEELVFRGLILGRLMKSYNPVISLGISSVLFCLFHITNPALSAMALANLLAGGVLLGITFSYTRNLWFGIFLHFAWNTMQGSVLGFPVSGLRLPSLLYSEVLGPVPYTGGSFGLEGSLLQFFLLLAGIWVLYIVNTRNSRR